MRISSVGSGAAVAFLIVARLGGGQEHEHGATPPEKLGTVRFETTCKAAVQAPFDRAVALLHSFEFGAATDAFLGVAKADPSCGIAYWGVALAAWSNPFAAGLKPPAQIARGRDAVDRATRAGSGSEREHGWVAAVGELYRDPEHRDQRARVLAYRDAMAGLAARHPEDMEATIFYALALAQAVPATDKTYADLLKAGSILEPL